MRVWMKLDEARKIVTPHLADKEIPQHVALGYVRYPLPPVIGWAPLLVLVVFQLLGRASTGVLGWVMALAWALLVNGLFTRRYLVATTSERFLLISLARLRKRERKNASWPLAQVGAEGLKEGKSRVRFNFRIANKRLRLDLADTYLENNKSSAAAIYQALLKGRGDTLPAPKWLRKEQLLDRVVIILAVIVPLVLVMVGVGILSGTELQQRVAGLLRGKLSVRVADDYVPSIVVPACQVQQGQAKVAESTYLCVASSAGDPIGQGKTWIYGSGDAAFRSDFFEWGNLVRVFVEGSAEPSAFWHFEFDPPKGQAWVAGLYQNAEERAFGDEAKPGLSVSAFSTACAHSRGRFEILELECDRSAGKVTHLAVNFEQSCDGGPPLLGVIRINGVGKRGVY